MHFYRFKHRNPATIYSKKTQQQMTFEPGQLVTESEMFMHFKRGYLVPPTAFEDIDVDRKSTAIHKGIRKLIFGANYRVLP